MNFFSEQLNNLSPHHFGFSHAGVEYLVCISPYLRTFPTEADLAYIDGYYEISNLQYHKSKHFISSCKSRGAIVEMEREKSYKSFLFERGFFARGKNSLLIDVEFGSKFYLTVLKVAEKPTNREDKLEFTKFLQVEKSKQARFKTPDIGCGNCDICLRACPQNAIPNQLENCLRHHMQNGEIKESFSCKLGSRVLGCEICSEACPKNAKIAIANQNQLSLLQLLALVEKKDASLCDIYGKNIIAKNKLIPYILNAFGNTHDEKYLEILQKYQQSQSEKIAFSAQNAILKIKNSNAPNISHKETQSGGNDEQSNN